MSARPDDLDATFRTWSDAREPELQRTAYLFTGDVATARGHVRSALAAVLSARVLDRSDLEPLALRALAAAAAAGSGRAAGHEVHDDGVAFLLEPGTDDRDQHGEERRRVVWDFLATLQPAPRAAVVLRLHRLFDDPEIAEVVGGSPRSVDAEIATVLSDLAHLLSVPAAEAQALAVTTLRLRAAATPVTPTPYDAVRATARRARRRRTRAGALLAAAAVLAVVVPVAALSGGGLPTPPVPSEPTPSRSSGIEPEDRVPPPWVLAPGVQLFKVELDLRCASPADEEFRSTTVIRAKCRTIVKHR